MTDTITPPISPGAERMRRHRQRLCDGLRCVRIEIRETEIAELIRRGHLKPEMRNSAGAIAQALYVHLDRTLDDSAQ